MQTKKGDIIEIAFTGRTGGVIFDTNREDDLKKMNSTRAPRKTLVILGEHMVVPGLDGALIGREIGTTFTVNISPQNGFGERQTRLVRPIPLKIFTSRNIIPKIGMTLLLDQSVVTIRAVSGARVIADFNNPLAGKDLEYNVTIVRAVEDVKEKTELFFEWFLRSKPEFEVGDKVIVKVPKQFEQLIVLFKEKFKLLIGKDLEVSIVEPPAQDPKSSGEATQ